MRRVVGGALGVVGGLAVWTLAEYWAHRALMHGRAARSLRGGPRHGLGAQHARHHRDPLDTTSLVDPGQWALRLGPGIAVAAVGRFCAVASGTGAGIALGGLAYTAIHHGIHHHGPGRWDRGRRHERHLRHHFGSPSADFGVTTGLWDVVFGTRSAAWSASGRRARPSAPGAVAVPAAIAPPWLVDATGAVHDRYAARFRTVGRGVTRNPVDRASAPAP